jgi:excinuclease ABC subunit C
VRDEAHRFCNSFHRKKRNKKSVESILEKIEGVGERRRKALYKTFKTLDNIRKATIKELEEVETMNISVAKNIYDFFHKEPESKR